MDPVIANDQPAPDFRLPDLDGREHTLSTLGGKVVIVNFWSAECPHTARTDQELRACLQGWGGEVMLLPVASNATESAQQIAQAAHERQLTTVLHDAHQLVADLYGAQTTPHFFVIDPGQMLRYQGAFDNVTFRRRKPSQHYLQEAVEAILDGRQPVPDQTTPYGCSIVRYSL